MTFDGERGFPCRVQNRKPDAVASADSARKTNCNDIPRDALAGILTTLTAVSDDDAVAVAHECCSNPAVAAAQFASEPVGFQTTWLTVPLRSSLRATANRCRTQPPVPNSRGPCPAPSRNYARSAAAPAPTQKFNRRTSFVFRMDI